MRGERDYEPIMSNVRFVQRVSSLNSAPDWAYASRWPRNRAVFSSMGDIRVMRCWGANPALYFLRRGFQTSPYCICYEMTCG